MASRTTSPTCRQNTRACSAYHASARIDQKRYRRLKVYLTDLAPRRSAEHMIEEFRMLHFEPYAPIRRQLLNLLRAVNRVRKQAGLEPVPDDCLRLKRRIYRPFGERS